MGRLGLREAVFLPKITDLGSGLKADFLHLVVLSGTWLCSIGELEDTGDHLNQWFSNLSVHWNPLEI